MTKVYGLVFIILILFMEFSYSTEHLICTGITHSKVTFGTRIALEERLFGRFVV